MEVFCNRCCTRSSKPMVGSDVYGRFDSYTSPPKSRLFAICLRYSHFFSLVCTIRVQDAQKKSNSASTNLQINAIWILKVIFKFNLSLSIPQIKKILRFLLILTNLQINAIWILKVIFKI